MSANPVVIRTARLVLRPLDTGDAGWIAAGIADWDVMQWLTTPPWPYRIEDALAFVTSGMSSGAFGIIVKGSGIGVVHINPEGELGYWLARSWHGQGLMTEAASALVADHFARGGGPLVSGYIAGNEASRNVLTKIGFRLSHTEVKPSRPRGEDVEIIRMAQP